jgi:hypothetical protein
MSADNPKNQDPTALVVVAVDTAKAEVRRDIESMKVLLQQQIDAFKDLHAVELKNISDVVSALTASANTTAKALSESTANALAKTEQATKEQLASAQTLITTGDRSLQDSIKALADTTESKITEIKKWLPGGESARALTLSDRGEKRLDQGTIISLIVAAVVVLSFLLPYLRPNPSPVVIPSAVMAPAAAFPVQK